VVCVVWCDVVCLCVVCVVCVWCGVYGVMWCVCLQFSVKYRREVLREQNSYESEMLLKIFT
jgi:hypothetical protein